MTPCSYQHSAKQSNTRLTNIQLSNQKEKKNKYCCSLIQNVQSVKFGWMYDFYINMGRILRVRVEYSAPGINTDTSINISTDTSVDISADTSINISTDTSMHPC